MAYKDLTAEPLSWNGDMVLDVAEDDPDVSTTSAAKRKKAAAAAASPGGAADESASALLGEQSTSRDSQARRGG